MAGHNHTRRLSLPRRVGRGSDRSFSFGRFGDGSALHNVMEGDFTHVPPCQVMPCKPVPRNLVITPCYASANNKRRELVDKAPI